jgi:hypothetical protein
VNEKESPYGNIRAMMYYKTQESLMKGGVLDAVKEEWLDDIKKQLCWAKGSRHKVTNKKMVEPKKDIKERVGQSPDVADGCVLLEAYEVIDKLPDHELGIDSDGLVAGTQPIVMKQQSIEELYGTDDDDLYN